MRFLIPGILVIILGCLILWYVIDTSVTPPIITDLTSLDWPVSEPDSGFYVCEGNCLIQNQYGLWELYLKGAPFERGVANGKLTKRLIAFQEEAFVNRIREMIPSDFYLHFLKYFIYFFNRDLDEYLMPEFKEEIYGISFSADPKFNFIGNPYQRMLNYHSAHDIGHALQDLMLVGCTSFGVWNQYSSDSSLLIGRNFDFYMGDAFAENKIICFEKPDNGFGFMTVTWGGMIGAVSGMNERGITVTINAAKSGIPMSARTPISIVAREILQYASSIDDAWQIAQNRKTFVSESILIGSGDENRAVIIEKAPFGIALVNPSENYIVCANHFQSELFNQDQKNIQSRQQTASGYRYQRVIQDINRMKPMSERDAASLLRDTKGINGADIGLGNEKAINQLIAHHSVIFKPKERLVWVSTTPWQLGEFVCYDLNEIFPTFATLYQQEGLTEQELMIPTDTLLNTTTYRNFLRFREMRDTLQDVQSGKTPFLSEEVFFDTFHTANPRFYETWSLTGDYYLKAGWPEKAVEYYQKALLLEIPGRTEREKIIQNLAAAMVQIKFNNK